MRAEQYQNADSFTRDLFDPRRLARAENPATSHQAAERVLEFAGQHHAMILGVLREHPEGMTVHEVAAYCRLTAHEVGKRVAELERAQRIATVLAESGQPVTRPTPSGRQARVWRAC